MSIIPQLIDGLTTRLTTDLDGVAKVADGPVPTSDFGDYVMIGIDDPDKQGGYILAGESTEDWAHANTTTIDQEGFITAAVLVFSGDSVFKPVRDKAFVIKSVIDNIVKNHTVLAIDELEWLQPSSHTYSQSSNTKGVVAFLVMRIGFKARY